MSRNSGQVCLPCVLHVKASEDGTGVNAKLTLIQCSGLDDIVAAPCETSEHIDDALRTFLAFTTTFKRRHRDETESHGLRVRADLNERGVSSVGVRCRTVLL